MYHMTKIKCDFGPHRYFVSRAGRISPFVLCLTSYGLDKTSPVTLTKLSTDSHVPIPIEIVTADELLIWWRLFSDASSSINMSGWLARSKSTVCVCPWSDAVFEGFAFGEGAAVGVERSG